MAHPINSSVDAAAPMPPIQQAQEMLAETLKTIRSISNKDGVDFTTSIFSTSEAVELLDNLDGANIKNMSAVTTVGNVMDHLRGALAELQMQAQHSETIEETTRTIAKTLAILYPLSKFEESRSPSPPALPRASVPQHIQERRLAPRFAIEAEVGFQSDTNFFMGFSEDISTGGLFISTYDIRSIGATLNLNFTLPDGHLISVDGVVRWVREYNETTPDTPPGMGVQFQGLSPEDKEAIEMFIEERPAMFYDDE
jgi:uncharacterized protein (TIGR02266 family)